MLLVLKGIIITGSSPGLPNNLAIEGCFYFRSAAQSLLVSVFHRRIPTSSASFYPLSSCHHCEETLCCHPKNRLSSPSQQEPFLPWTSPFTSSLAGMKTPAKSLCDSSILQAFVSASQQSSFLEVGGHHQSTYSTQSTPCLSGTHDSFFSSFSPFRAKLFTCFKTEIWCLGSELLSIDFRCSR